MKALKMTARDKLSGARMIQHNSTPAPAVTKRWKWMLCGVLFLATVLNYLDRQTMGLCKPKIMEEFRINNEQFGNLLAAFRWTYALAHVPAGFIADRFPLRPFFALAVGLWSFAGAAAFWTGTLRLFKWSRACLGLGESVNWPFSTRIVSNLLSPADRGLGMGIFNSGAALGALIAPLVITPIASALGWRWSFLITGSAGFAWVIIWLWFTRGNRAAAFANQNALPASGETPRQLLRPFRVIFSHPGFWLLILAAVTINPCWYFCCDWIPGYLKEQSGFSFLRAGLLVTFIFLGGDVGNYVGGGLIKFLTHHGQSVRRARRATLVIGATLASLIIAVPHLRGTTLVVGFLATAAIGINIIVPNQTACMADISFQDTAQVAGLTGMSANLFAAWANPRIGHYVDATGHYDLIFYMVALFTWIAVAAIISLDRLTGK
ncbi:MAG TPA: MFS transporter [Verrucomicrobiae bacterium]|nr:MFS transporter [Verrucomicrobiae bacterium]